MQKIRIGGLFSNTPATDDPYEDRPHRVSRAPPIRLLLASILVTFGAPFHYGFQLTITSPAEEAFIRFANESVMDHFHPAEQLNRKQIEPIWSMTVSLFFAGAVPGSVCLQQIADRLGRKRGLILANFAVSLCAALEGASKFMNSIELFAFARFFLGFWMIIGVGIGSVFLAECSPKYCRGAIGMTTGILIQIGTMAGAILAIPQIWGDDTNWWRIYAFEFIAQIGITLGLTILHESPSYLLFHKKELQCRHSIQFYYGIRSDELLGNVLAELRANLHNNAHSLGMLAVWREAGGSTRRGLRLAIVLGLCMAFCGVAVVDAYIVGIFRKMGHTLLRASLANILVMLISLIFGLISATIVDKLGRRPLLLFSFVAMFCTNFCVAILMFTYRHYSKSEWVSMALTVAITLFISEFTFGLGSFFYFVVAETVSQSGRSAAQGWAKFAHTFARSVVLALYLPLRNLIGDGQAYAILFLPILGCAGIYLYFCMPETKNRNLLEVEAELAKLPKLFGKNPKKTPRRSVVLEQF